MRRRLPFKLAGNILLAALVLLIAFQLLALVRALPALAASGVIVQLVALVAFALAVAAKTGYLRAGRLRPLADIGVWVLLLFLVLNLIGLLAAGALLVSPVTTVIALLSIPLTYRVAIGR